MLKRYWYISVIIILIGLISWQQSCYNKLIDGNIAEQIKVKVINAELVKQKKIADDYIIKNKKADEDIATKNQIINELNIKTNTWYNSSVITESKIKQLKTYSEQLTGMIDLFHGCQDYVLKLGIDYNKATDDLNFAWQSKVKTKDDEISTLNDSWSDVTTRLGDCTKTLVIAQLKAHKALNLGFFAGMSIDGRWAAGFGLTFTIIKLPSFLGGIL